MAIYVIPGYTGTSSMYKQADISDVTVLATGANADVTEAASAVNDILATLRRLKVIA